MKKMKRMFLKQINRISISVVNFRTFYPVIAYQIIYFASNVLVYPIAKLTIGAPRYEKIIATYLKKLISEKIIVPLPSSKKKIEMRKDDWVILVELYEDKVYPQELLKEGLTVVDVGGHIGIYSLMASERVGEKGMVIVAEPERDNFKQLLKNIKLNRILNISPFQTALADYCGTGKLYLHSRLARHSLSLTQNESKFEEVRILTLDALLQQSKVTKVDLIKIDAEGAELEILKGAERTISDNPEVKFIIAAYHYPNEERELVEYLADKQIQTKIVKDINEKSIIITV